MHRDSNGIRLRTPLRRGTRCPHGKQISLQLGGPGGERPVERRDGPLEEGRQHPVTIV